VSRVRIGVVGVGYMGRLHAQKLAALAAQGEVDFRGVADLDGDRAREVAGLHGVAAFSEVTRLFPELDALVVAVPTQAHHRVVVDALKAGIDVLVEKPIAASLAEAEEMLAVAAAGARLLQVGHLERYNAAIRVVESRIRRPRFVEVHRMGPWSSRGTDVDVVRDLMIHDLDLLQRFIGEEPARVDAVGVPILSERIDIANARLTFPGGCVANVTASRVSATPLRKLRFFQADGYFSIDFLAQSVVVIERVAEGEAREGDLLAGGDSGPALRVEKFSLDREDAIALQLADFVRCVRSREHPAMGGEEALRALRTAVRVVEAMAPLGDSV
jgi:predicted dehydrogenase